MYRIELWVMNKKQVQETKKNEEDAFHTSMSVYTYQDKEIFVVFIFNIYTPIQTISTICTAI